MIDYFMNSPEYGTMFDRKNMFDRKSLYGLAK